MRIKFVLLILLCFCSCKKQKEIGSNKTEPLKGITGLLTAPYPTETYDLGFNKLSEYGFFKQPLNTLEPINDRVIPYDLNSPLFSDYTSKKRFIFLPEGTSANYINDEEVLDFPLGTIIIKNFYYKGEELSGKDKILETRLLIHDEKTKEWQALPYIWNEEQTEAFLYILGKDIEVSFSKEKSEKVINFTYSTPNINMCKNCHMNDKKLAPIGPSPMQLHKINASIGNENQLSYLKEHGYLNNLADVNEVEKIPSYSNTANIIDNRARAYLQANCAHCHSKKGSAKTSGLFLNYHEKDEHRIGVNKPPIAAGQGSGNLLYGIVKGEPDASILVYRMSHTEPHIVMPEVGKTLLHDEGIALIREWIEKMN